MNPKIYLKGLHLGLCVLFCFLQQKNYLFLVYNVSTEQHSETKTFPNYTHTSRHIHMHKHTYTFYQKICTIFGIFQFVKVHEKVQKITKQQPKTKLKQTNNQNTKQTNKKQTNPSDLKYPKQIFLAGFMVFNGFEAP